MEGGGSEICYHSRREGTGCDVVRRQCRQVIVWKEETLVFRSGLLGSSPGSPLKASVRKNILSGNCLNMLGGR